MAQDEAGLNESQSKSNFPSTPETETCRVEFRSGSVLGLSSRCSSLWYHQSLLNEICISDTFIFNMLLMHPKWQRSTSHNSCIFEELYVFFLLFLNDFSGSGRTR